MKMREKALVLYSGGKDSFLVAARAVEDMGLSVTLLSCNGGTVWGEENLLHGAKRLENKYGPDMVSYAGCAATSAIVQRLNEPWIYRPWQELGEAYPALANVQANCLHCQTAMWIAAVAYAEAHGIRRIMAGYKASDTFCTGMPEWTGAMRRLAESFGIRADYPLWSTPEWESHPDAGRDEEMIRRLFEPRVLEPKCLLGRPAEAMPDAARKDLMRYFEAELEPRLPDLVRHMIPIYGNIRLGTASLQIPDYPLPEKTDGLY